MIFFASSWIESNVIEINRNVFHESSQIDWVLRHQENVCTIYADVINYSRCPWVSGR